MALKKCKECGKEVSSKAKKCPNCGNKSPPENKALNFFIGLGIIIFLIYLIYLFSGNEAAINENADGFSTLSLNPD